MDPSYTNGFVKSEIKEFFFTRFTYSRVRGVFVLEKVKEFSSKFSGFKLNFPNSFTSL